MTRDEFKAHTIASLEDSIVRLEGIIGVALPRDLAFQWLTEPDSYYFGDEVIEGIVARVYVDEDHIWPCVDIGPSKILPDGRLLIVATRAGHPPRPFSMNWTGRMGPFVLVYGGDFVNLTFDRQGKPDMETVVPANLQRVGKSADS
jgi:hypothetical protein